MTDNEAAEFGLLKLTNDDGVFAIAVDAALTEAQAKALMRLQRRRWVTLIDVSPIAAMDGVFRVFMATDYAMTWYRANC